MITSRHFRPHRACIKTSKAIHNLYNSYNRTYNSPYQFLAFIKTAQRNQSESFCFIVHYVHSYHLFSINVPDTFHCFSFGLLGAFGNLLFSLFEVVVLETDCDHVPSLVKVVEKDSKERLLCISTCLVG